MATKNDVTGDAIQTKVVTDSYRNNFDRIFGGKVELVDNSVPSEDQEQMTFVQWFRRHYGGVLIFAIPNGGHRHPAVAAKLKATGTVAGIPDLFVPEWRLWIEMKRVKGGKVSQAQQDIMEHLESIDYWVIVAKGADDAKMKVLDFCKNVRAFNE